MSTLLFGRLVLVSELRQAERVVRLLAELGAFPVLLVNLVARAARARQLLLLLLLLLLLDF